MNIYAIKHNKLLPLVKIWELMAPILTNDKFFLTVKCFLRTDLYRRLRISQPITFNDKLNWLKLYRCKPEYTQMVDKYAVKDYVTEKIGSQYIIPTIGVYQNVDDIDWNSLPKQFVLKCTHDSGGIVVCKDKDLLDISAAKRKLKKCLKRDFYASTREKPYRDVPKRIIAEKFMEDPVLHELRDYKFFCFNGKVKVFKVDFDRYIDHHANYYDVEGKLLPFGEALYPPDYKRKIEFPQNLREMIDMAEKLAGDIPFVRIDLYNIQGAIYFGEMTFYPMSGLERFTSYEWEKKMGDWIVLNEEKYDV